MPTTYDPRYDPALAKTKVRPNDPSMEKTLPRPDPRLEKTPVRPPVYLEKTAPIQAGSRPSNPAAYYNNNPGGTEKLYRGIGDRAMEGMLESRNGDLVAKEMARRGGVRMGLLPALSHADNAMLDNQLLAATEDVAANKEGLKELQARNSAANAHAQYPNSATPGYEPNPSRPDMTQQYRPMTESRMQAQADTKQFNQQQQQFADRRFARNNLERIPGPEGQVEAYNPNKAKVPLRAGIGRLTAEQAAAELDRMNVGASPADPAGIGPAKPTTTQKVVSAAKGIGKGGIVMPVLERGAKITKGGVAGTVLAGAEGVSNQVALNDQTTGAERVAQASEDVSRALGATAGATVGGTYGSAAGPFGTVVGGLIGGTLGYFLPGEVVSFGRKATNWASGNGFVDPGSPLEKQQNAGTADLSIGQRAFAAADRFIENEKRDVPPKADAAQSNAGPAAQQPVTQQPAVATTPVSGASTVSGAGGPPARIGWGGGGAGYMRDSNGNQVNWNPDTQSFDGRLVADKGVQVANNAPVNSAGQMFQPQRIGAPAQQQGGGGRVVVLNDSANDPYKKILNDRSVPAALKAKLQMKLDALEQGDRRVSVDERQQALAEELGIAKFGLDARGQQLDQAGKQLQIEQALKVRGLQERIAAEEDPAARQLLMDQYDALTGQTGKYQVAQADTGVPDGFGGTVKQSVIVNQRTGQYEPIQQRQGIGQMPATKRGPDGSYWDLNPATGEYIQRKKAG